jgi:hypothetical protein
MSMSVPAWLPPMFVMSPWSDEVMERLYAIFRTDFVFNPVTYQGCRVWFFPEMERGKELIFWHLVEREDPPRSGIRLPDFRRAERLTWARPTLLNHTDPAVLAWDFEEGASDIRTYVWLKDLDYVVVMKRYSDGARRLITAYWIDYPSKRKTLQSKYARRL